MTPTALSYTWCLQELLKINIHNIHHKYKNTRKAPFSAISKRKYVVAPMSCSSPLGAFESTSQLVNTNSNKDFNTQVCPNSEQLHPGTPSPSFAPTSRRAIYDFSWTTSNAAARRFFTKPALVRLSSGSKSTIWQLSPHVWGRWNDLTLPNAMVNAISMPPCDVSTAQPLTSHRNNKNTAQTNTLEQESLNASLILLYQYT